MYKLPLDDYCLESVVVPFYSSTMMNIFKITVENIDTCPSSYQHDWCCGSVLWHNKLHENNKVIVTIKGGIDVSSCAALIFRNNVPAECTYSLEFLAGEKVVGKTQNMQGAGKPCEHIFPHGDIFGVVPGHVTGIRIHALVPPASNGVMQLFWLGIRNAAYEQVAKDIRARRSFDWSPWLIPAEERGPLRFLRGLVFSENDLEDVRRKAQSPGWRSHFALLEKEAEHFFSNNPEERFDAYLPSMDARFSRTLSPSYHWEALVLGFVGLVNNNQRYIDHALRYLMCMVHTMHWRYSGQERSASDPWSARAFLEELTATSVALLYDWFYYALKPQATEQIRSALWTRGVTFVRYDLLSQDYMHTMNQGVVFNRGCVLAGLMLEAHLPRVRPYVDLAYEEMLSITGKYIQPDGSVPEGVGYHCQMSNGLIWAVIAWCRARGKNWESVLKKIYKNAEKYAHAMASTTGPGKMIPYGDCRLEDWSGDVVPVLARLFPGSFFAGILQTNLELGKVYTLTGTLSKSGGLIGMVYGPPEPATPEQKLPEVSRLPQGGKVSVTCSKNNSLVRLWFSGSRAKASHTHQDIGSFVLEVNEERIFEDPGMIDYWYPGGDLLKSTHMHNCVTPVIDNVSISQSPPTRDSLPYVRKSGDMFTMGIDGAGAWGKHFSSYARTIRIDSEKDVLINDRMKCRRKMPVAFHLHSLFEPKVENKRITLFTGKSSILIDAPWLADIQVKKDKLCFKHIDIYHISLLSPQGIAHNLTTKIVINGPA